jgi:hypothetical protein
LRRNFLLGLIAEVKTDEANKDWGKTLRLAFLAILDKTDGTVRVIHDGTHGIQVNPAIKVWNQARCPGVAEKRVVRQKVRDADTLRLGLKGDVEGKIHGRDLGRRAIWVADWCGGKCDHTSVLMQEVIEVLGRLAFATQAVEHFKPLLGPLFAWTAAVPSGSFVELPSMVRLILSC